MKDCFDATHRVCPDHDEGTVIIIDWDFAASPALKPGEWVMLISPDGIERRAEIAEVKEHGPAISLFFKGFRREQLPIGTIVVPL